MLSWLLACVLAPPTVGLILLLGSHSRTLNALWREPVLVRPVVIFESDDWGPGEAAHGACLYRLVELLDSVRDSTGAPAVMTLGVVPAAPDGPAILAAGCKRYFRRTLAEPEFQPIADAIRAGCRRGTFALQRHGTEHCWPSSLLARARADGGIRDWLAGPIGATERLPSELQSRWTDAGELPSRALNEAEVEQAVADEAALFEQIFGSRPGVAVPTTFVWSEAVEKAWADGGVRWVVTPGRRYDRREADGSLRLARSGILNAQAGQHPIRYIVRDDYFEPLRGHRAEQVWSAIGAKFRQGRPCLLEIHRENFIGADAASEAAFAEFERALRGLVSRFSELRFVSTEVLAQQLAANHGDLIARTARARVLAWIERLCCEPSLARLLKYSGLRWLIRLFANGRGGVNSGRSAKAID